MDNPNSCLDGLKMEGIKRHVEVDTTNKPRATHYHGVSSSIIPKDNATMTLKENGASKRSLSVGNDPPPQSFIWNDPIFDAIEFTTVRIAFHEYFSGDYKAIYNRRAL